MSSNELYAIVPAAGIGSRMRHTQPKQYMLLGQFSVIEQTLRILLNHGEIQFIVVVLHPRDRQFAHLAVAADPRIKITVGGAQRAESVLAGLALISNGWVLVHDAVRPYLHPDDLRRLLKGREECADGAILATPVRDSIKRGNAQDAIVGSLPRQGLWQALTPQLFPVSLLKACLQQALADSVDVSDEASALTYCGYSPALITGRADNVKITYPEDLRPATYLLSESGVANKEEQGGDCVVRRIR